MGSTLKNESSLPISKKKKTSCLIQLLTGFAGCGLVLFFLLGNYLIVSDPIEKADAIVVLSGGEKDRLPEAAELFTSGYSDTVILTDTGYLSEGSESEAAVDPNVIKAYDLTQMGVPISNILITRDVVGSTMDEANSVLVIMQKQGFQSMIIVTDPYHSRRTKLVFERVFQDSGITVRIQSVKDHWFTGAGWWFHPDGWKYMVTEYAKLFAFWFLKQN